MVNKKLIGFIKEAREKGFDDYQIKEPLIKNGWPIEQIEEAFASLRPRIKHKNKVTLYLDSEVLKSIDKRAKKNLLTLPEQIEDILRRSVLSSKKTKGLGTEKLDDSLLAIFSRRQRKTLKKKG